MSDQTTEETQHEVTPEDMISRGKGVKIEALEEGSEAAQAVTDFLDLVARHQAAEAEADKLKEERNLAIYDLKANHNVSFSAIAEIIGGTSSLVLYLYERAQGKSAKQIREESQASAAAKAQFRETNPDARPARKQTPEEKAFRKAQREALQAFLAEQKAAGVNTDDAQAELEAEAAYDEADV
jgi:hypothetical protein